MLRIVLLISLFVSGSCTAAPSCNADGAFGITFGSRPPTNAKVETKGNVATWYVVAPPEPDPSFDTFQVRINNSNSEVFEVVATKTITRAPALSEPPINPEQRRKGEERAMAFALQYIAQLPPELQSRVALQKYSKSNWEATVSQEVVLSISAGFAWDVTVSCKDTKREWELARKSLPELFEGRSK